MNLRFTAVMRLTAVLAAALALILLTGKALEPAPGLSGRAGAESSGSADARSAGAAESGADNADVILIIDSSGSMSWNDPPGDSPGCDADHQDKCPDQCTVNPATQPAKRHAAARAFVATALQGDLIGIVDFDADAVRASSLAQVPDDKETLLDAIKTIDSCGQTNLREALEVACIEFLSNGVHNQRGAILLTDGDHLEDEFQAFGSPQSCFSQKGWPVYTFGFGDADAGLLGAVAADTGGQFESVPVTKLLCEFQRVRTLIAGETPPPCHSVQVLYGLTGSIELEMPPGQSQATFSASWDVNASTALPAGATEIQVGVTLITPSGATVQPDDPNVVHDSGSGFDIYTSATPRAEPGG